jgi:hypothetical protein
MSYLQLVFSLHLAISSFTLKLRRLGLYKLSRLEPKAAIIRYEHKAPNDMIHLVIKKLGRIVGAGHRITVDLSKRGHKSGWEHLHVTTATWPTPRCFRAIKLLLQPAS